MTTPSESCISRVAGFGFREAASMESLHDALIRAGGTEGLSALATLTQKAHSAALQALALQLGLPIHSVSRDALAKVETASHSARMMEEFGTGCLAEAVALVAAGAGSRLLGCRSVSADGMTVAAIAGKIEEISI